MSRPRHLLLLALLGAAPLAPATAQEFFGHWDDVSGGQPSTELYVSPSGNDGNNGLSPGDPKRTVTAAVAAALIEIANGRRATVNVLPGTYTVGETFPLTIPAHGLALEACPQADLPIDAPAILRGSRKGQTLIQMNSLGDLSMPATVVRGLGLAVDGTGVLIDLVHSGPEAVDLAPEIRDCTIHQLQFQQDPAQFAGVYVKPGGELYEAVILVGNDITASRTSGSIGIRVEAASTITSCTLVRGNRVQNCEIGVSVYGYNDPGRSMPRLLSNAVQLCETCVWINNSNAFVANNTIAFAETLVLSNTTALGLGWSGQSLELYNNNIWCPDYAGQVKPPKDVGIAPQNLNGVQADNNNDQDGFLAANFLNRGNVSLSPGFVGGDTHPTPSPADLHLLATSPLLDRGGPGWVSPQRFVTVTNGTVSRQYRGDHALDYDLDSRALAIGGSGPGTVRPDMGCDELAEVALRRAQTAGDLARLDHLGNLLAYYAAPGDMPHWWSDVLLTGPPHALYVVDLGSGFFITLSPPPHPNGPVHQNTFTGIGQLALDPASPQSMTIFTGALDGNGQAILTVDFGTQPTTFVEAEFYLQATVLDPVAFGQGIIKGWHSARMPIELNE